MKIFKDTQGRDWKLRLTIGTCRKLKDELAFDLFEEMEFNVAVKLCWSPETAGKVLACLLAAQLAERSIEPQSWIDDLDVETLTAGRDALLEEIDGFFRLNGSIAKIIDQVQQRVRESMAAAGAAISAGKSGDESGSAPESSASTPTPTP